jgi:hypothetical protein
MTNPLEQVYDAAFFRDVERITAESAAAAVPHILALVPTTRVIDVGAGEGHWVEQFAARGCNILAVDGPHVDRRRLRVPPGAFVAHDLRRRLPTALSRWDADLVLCLEVAEHLPAWRGPGLIREICELAPRIVFSAASPGQGGRGHVNEQDSDYWIALFEDCGFAITRRLNRLFAKAGGVASWYVDNTFLAVRI